MDSATGITVGLSSLVLNSLNFLLFDVLLAAAVYYLTADIAGLTNSLSAVQGKDERISFYSPAFFGVGVGITCTSKRVFYMLALFRLVSISLVFISSTSFVGEKVYIPAEIEANVTVLGKFGRHEDYTSLRPRQLLREGCQGRTNSTIYYGEIRDKKFCELNRSRISNLIEFDFFPHPETLNFSACIPERQEESWYMCDSRSEETIACSYASRSSKTTGGCSLFRKTPFSTCVPQNKSNSTFACGTDSKLYQNCSLFFRHEYVNFRCQNAIIGCAMNSVIIPCRATVNLGNVTHLCDGNGTRIAGVYPILLNKSLQGESQDLNNLLFHCKKAKGAEWQLDHWLPHMGRDLLTLDHAYAAMYGSGSEKRTVKIEKVKNITTISWGWVAILCLKLVMIVGLSGAVLMMRKWKGCLRVANDEVGLGSLLLSSKARLPGLISDDQRAEAYVSRDGVLVEMEDSVVRVHAENTAGRRV